MSSIRFFNAQKDNPWDEYFFLAGISERLGHYKYEIINGRCVIQESPSYSSKDYLKTTLKITSYFTLALPLAFMVGKGVTYYARKEELNRECFGDADESLLIEKEKEKTESYDFPRISSPSNKSILINEIDPKTVNDVDRFGRSPLFLAVVNGDITKIEVLIEKGAHIECIDKNGMTLLHYAAAHHKQEACELLLNKGLNMNAKCSKGCTPLHFAVHNAPKYQNDYPFIKFLIDNKAELETLSEEKPIGYTPFHKAICNGNGALVTFLLKMGADKTVKTSDGKSPLELAQMHCPAVVKKLF